MIASADTLASPFAGKQAARSPLLDARSRTWVLVATAACLLPLLLQLPSRLSLVLAALGIVVVALSWQRRLPSVLRVLLTLGLIGYIFVNARFAFGRDTGCALLAAMLVIKPVELFSLRDGRSLLGFALFAPFSTFLLDQGPLSLVLGLIGATLALAALVRLSDQDSGDAMHVSAPLQRVWAVARLMAIGLPLALAAFWLFPRIATPMWGLPERALARPGLSDKMSPGQWLDFMADDSPALRVKFFGRTPPTSQMYWRGPVLWNFDGRTWTQPQWLRGLPPAPVTHGSAQWDYEMEVEPTDRRQLVALELPLAAPAGTRLSFDYGLFNDKPLATLTRWRMQSSPPRTFGAHLSIPLQQIALQLPDGFNPRTVALGEQWRREADQDPRIPGGSKDAAIVDRTLAWIRKEFAYTLDTPLPGRNSVDEFLFEQKAGFCEHYSSAFVVLMRAAGIPARVVTGYVGGYRNRYGDYWVVRRMDAHAWAEVWLSQRGWVRVDPTAAVAPERIYDTLDDRAASGFGAGLAPMLDMGDWLRRGWNDFVLGFDATRQTRLLQPLGIKALDQTSLIALFATTGGLALAWMVWLATRREREHDKLLRAWHRLDARYAKLGLARAPFEPAGQWAARVQAARPQQPQTAELATLSVRFAEWRYALGQRSSAGMRSLLRDLCRHRP